MIIDPFLNVIMYGLRPNGVKMCYISSFSPAPGRLVAVLIRVAFVLCHVVVAVRLNLKVVSGAYD